MKFCDFKIVLNLSVCSRWEFICSNFIGSSGPSLPAFYRKYGMGGKIMEVFAISNLVSGYRMNQLYWDYFQGQRFRIRTSFMIPERGMIEKKDRKGRGG